MGKLSYDISAGGEKVFMRVLLLDDNNACLESLITALEPAGYQCAAFVDPIEAMRAYRQHGHDVVITDLKLPGMNGVQVLKLVRSWNTKTEVILITGYGDINSAIVAVNLHAYAYLVKPLNLEELIGILEEIAQQRCKEDKLRNECMRIARECTRLSRLFEELSMFLNRTFDTLHV